MGFLDRVMNLFGGDPGSKDWQKLVDRSMAGLGDRTAELDRRIGLGEAEWEVDLAEGWISFACPDGREARAAVQVVGTYNSDDGTFLWGWDHPSVPEGVDRAAKAVRQWGEEHDVAKLAPRSVACSEQECWEFTAAAFHLTEASGAYRGPSGSTFVFMTFDELVVAGETMAFLPPPPPVVFGALVDVPETAQDVVRGFLQARFDWEVAAHDARGDGAEEAYAALVAEWCVAAVQPQGISYGSDPSWHPDRMSLLGGALMGSRAAVLARSRTRSGFESDHEVHVVLVDGTWRIAALLYIDDDDRWECI